MTWTPVTPEDAAEAAWKEYRNDLLSSPTSGIHRTRQLRKREFITGYLRGYGRGHDAAITEVNRGKA